MLSDSLKAELIHRLETDSEIQFKKRGNELRDGICPNCGHRELFISLSKPFKVQCRRFNNCNYSETVRNLYPDLFENFSRRYPSTDTNPNATADAYMRENRGFDLSLVSGMYSQNWKKLKTGKFAATVRFPLWGKDYWERLIDADMVRINNGSKAHFSYGTDYAGRAWAPPNMKIEPGDIIFITEGIFKSLAFIHKKHKSISALSCSNFPSKFIQEHKGKDITWIIALDNDPAGLAYSHKHRREIQRMNEKCLVAIPKESEDWDDVYRAGRLDDKYTQESLWRAYFLLAETAEEKAFFHWLKYRYDYHIFVHDNSLWKYKIESKGKKDGKVNIKPDSNWMNISDFGGDIAKFYSFTQISRISNCLPEFLYIERDSLTDEQLYNFRFLFKSGNPPVQVTFDGSALENASAFNSIVLKKTPGGTFDGSIGDMKVLRDEWFNHKITYVKKLSFIGYDRDSEAYIYPDFGYRKGQLMELNDEGFMSAGKLRIKTGLTSIPVHRPSDSANLEWISDFQDAFGLNGLTLMSWWLGCLFAEQIRKKMDSWPFMEYTGEFNAGKTTQLKFMWRCCGINNHEGVDPSKASTAALGRIFQQVANLPVALIESDRSEDRGARKGAFNMDELKTAFNGNAIRALGIMKRGAATEEPPFRGGILISQNATVTGSEALLSRIVHCHCTKAHFSTEGEQKARRLSAMTTEELSGWLITALQNEAKLLENYFPKQKEIHAVWRNSECDSRIILCHAQVAAWAWQLPTLFGDRISKETCKALEEHIFKRAQSRNKRLGADDSIVEQFWEQYEYLNPKIGEYGPCQALNHSLTANEIAISLPHFQELVNSHQLERLPLSELKKRLPDSRHYKFIGQKKVWSANSRKTLHCWCFKEPYQPYKTEDNHV